VVRRGSPGRSFDEGSTASDASVAAPITSVNAMIILICKWCMVAFISERTPIDVPTLVIETCSNELRRPLIEGTVFSPEIPFRRFQPPVDRSHQLREAKRSSSGFRTFPA
jgi:hypothetical protein